MKTEQINRDNPYLRAKNVGGITESELELRKGVNILVGRNATNRTSHLQALMAALGSDNVSLKSDTDRGRVELVIDGEVYTRELAQRNETIQTSGEPLLDDTKIADLFAFLLESNEARQAVTRQKDLRELIMRPVDTVAIEREISRCKSQQSELSDRLDELDAMKNRLPTLEEQSQQYTEQIEEKKEERAELEEQIEAADAKIEETRERKDELERKLNELQETRSELEDVQYRIETEQDSIDSLREEQTELKSELNSLPTSVKEISEIGSEIERLQERKSVIDSSVDSLNNVIQFNQEMLTEETESLHHLLGESDVDSGAITDQLLSDEQTVVCWTCGSEVERNQIKTTIDTLNDVSNDMLTQRRSVKSELDELRQKKNEIETKQHRRDQIEHKLDQVHSEMRRRKQTLEDLQDEQEPLREEIERLEGEIERMEETDYGDILDLHKQANEVDFRIEQLQNDVRKTRDEIESIEKRLDEYGDIEAERERLNERLEELRTKIDRIEREAIEQFNEHMDNVIDLLGYDNIERIWIERMQSQVTEGRRTVTEDVFALHVTRRNESGAAYSDTIDHLSESEREVTGLVFALAGYLVHDLHDVVPFMLLDSLEALDSERIAALIEYFEDLTENIVVALLPEDAAALSDEYNQITDIA